MNGNDGRPQRSRWRPRLVQIIAVLLVLWNIGLLIHSHYQRKRWEAQRIEWNKRQADWEDRQRRLPEEWRLARERGEAEGHAQEKKLRDGLVREYREKYGIDISGSGDATRPSTNSTAPATSTAP